MAYYTISNGVIAGICLGFSIIFLFTGLRRKDNKRLNLLFATFALAYAATLFNGTLFHNAASVEQYVRLSRWDAVAVVLVFTALIWYVAEYSRVRPRIFLWILTSLFVAVGIANIVRTNMIYDQILGLIYLIMPWGEQIAYIEATDSAWSLLFLAIQLAVLIFIVFACLRQYRRGERREAVILSVGVLWFVAAIATELLGQAGVIAPIFYGEFGFLGFVVAISLQMANQVIETEEELEAHQGDLKILVEERTADLTAVNKNLALEATKRQRVSKVLKESEARLAGIIEFALDAIITVDEERKIIQFNPGAEDLFGYPAEIALGQSLNLLLPKEFHDSHNILIDDFAATNISARRMGDLGMVWGKRVSGQSFPIEASISQSEVKGKRLYTAIVRDISQRIEHERKRQKEVGERATIDERNRLAQDLHDAVTQTIYSAALIAEALPAVWERNPEQGRLNLGKLRQLVRGALAEMRTLLFELRPDALEEAELENLLRQLGDGLTGRSRIPVETIIEGESDIPAEVKITLYRISQEAFNNVAKHSGADVVTNRLRYTPDQVILSITDNGRGFKPATIPADHFGLQIMSERAISIGAKLDIVSDPGQGTTITVRWPTSDQA